MRAVDISGVRFDRLVAIERVDTGPDGVVWLCRCDCGQTTRAAVKKLKMGNKRSCGCLVREVTSQRNAASATHGKTKTPEFTIWTNMLQRCGNPRHKSYLRYGGRGITVCAEWRNSFESFLRDVGERPSSRHQLDRADNERGYDPGNCRWVLPKENARNRSTSKTMTLDGVTKTISEWAEELGCSRQALAYRLRAGLSSQDAISRPFNHANRFEDR